MKLVDLQEAKYAAHRITVRILTEILWEIEHLLYDRDTLFEHFDVGEEMGWQQFEDQVIGFDHDALSFIKIEDGYAADRYPNPNPPKPDYVIMEESFDQALEEGWLEIINETH